MTIQIEKKIQGPQTCVKGIGGLEAGIFEGVLPQAAEGDVRGPPACPRPCSTARSRRHEFRVEAPASEIEHTEMNQPELRHVAAITHGKFFTPATLGTLLEDLPKPQKVPLDTDPPIPLWNTWPVLGLFLILIVGEWLLRKRKRMV